MAEYTYILPGDPVALSRCRVNFHSNKVWDSQKHDKLHASLTIKRLHGDRPLFDKPVCLNATFYIEIPKTKRKSNLENQPHYYRPDTDNLLKFLADILSKGVLFRDDCIITDIICCKRWSINPRTEFTIKEI
jgi:Holliday junction resolvase RusA-like endonuclease